MSAPPPPASKPPPAEAGGTAAVTRAPVRFLGLRRSGLIEMAGFYVLVLALDFVFFEGTRFRSVTPHPFWLIVMLMAVQYGTNEGLVAAAVSSAVLLVGNLPPQRIEQDLYAYLFEISWQPTGWLLSAVVFGELRMRQSRREEELAVNLDEANRETQVITATYRQMALAKDQLEARVAGQMRTVISTYQAAKGIEKLGPGEVMAGVSGLVRAILSPEAFSVFVLNRDALEAMLCEGWTEEDKFGRRFAASAPLFAAIVSGRQVVCAARANEERVLAGEGVLAGPLVNPDTGELIGMLKIERMGFREFNIAAIENFRVLCDWIGTAYATALRYQLAEETSVLSGAGQLMSAGYFERQSKFMRSLAARVGFDVPLVVLRIEDADRLDPDTLGQVSQAISDAVQRQLRTTDLAFDFRRQGYEYVLMLPATPVANAGAVADKLLADLKRNLPSAASNLKMTASVQVLHEVKRDERA